VDFLYNASFLKKVRKIFYNGCDEFIFTKPFSVVYLVESAVDINNFSQNGAVKQLC